MKHRLNVWVIGGDQRQVYLAQLLRREGHTVHIYALEQAADDCEEEPGQAHRADCVILPLPVTGNGSLLNAPLSDRPHPLSAILDALRPGQVICAGKVDSNTAALAAKRGLVLHDYFAREELAVANAVPTVEGAIQIAMEQLPITLHGARVLVIGCGRIGRLLAHRLKALGAKVSLSARKCADLAWAEAHDFCVEHTDELDGWLCPYDLVVNTVPARVLDAQRLAELKEGCLVLDLASKPGGVDFEAARQLGVRTVHALSLPGRVAPVTAARAVWATICNILREEGF